MCERLARVYLFMGSIPALDRVIKEKARNVWDVWTVGLQCSALTRYILISVQHLDIRGKKKKKEISLAKQFIF